MGIGFASGQASPCISSEREWRLVFFFFSSILTTRLGFAVYCGPFDSCLFSSGFYPSPLPSSPFSTSHPLFLSPYDFSSRHSPFSCRGHSRLIKPELCTVFPSQREGGVGKDSPGPQQRQEDNAARNPRNIRGRRLGLEVSVQERPNGDTWVAPRLPLRETGQLDA